MTKTLEKSELLEALKALREAVTQNRNAGMKPVYTTLDEAMDFARDVISKATNESGK